MAKFLWEATASFEFGYYRLALRAVEKDRPTYAVHEPVYQTPQTRYYNGLEIDLQANTDDGAPPAWYGGNPHYRVTGRVEQSHAEGMAKTLKRISRGYEKSVNSFGYPKEGGQQVLWYSQAIGDCAGFVGFGGDVSEGAICPLSELPYAIERALIRLAKKFGPSGGLTQEGK